jgi:putative Holliday junction resolvase
MTTLHAAAESALAQIKPGTRLMGLDLGTKTIGVATSDLTRQIATPRLTIARKKFTEDAKALLDLAAAENTDIPMVFWDERLSTVAVTRTMLEADLSRAKRAENVDKLAAAYILQSFLDAIR